jgi:hypothetical protein
MEARCFIFRDTFHSDTAGRRGFLTLMEGELAAAFPRAGEPAATVHPIASS